MLAYSVRTAGELQSIRAAAGMRLRVVRLAVCLDQIEQRLASDVTSGRGDDLRAAAQAITVGQGTGLEDLAISNDEPVTIVARQIIAFLGWMPG